MEQAHSRILWRDPGSPGIPSAGGDHSEPEPQTVRLAECVGDGIERLRLEEGRARRHLIVRVPDGPHIPDVRTAHPLGFHLLQFEGDAGKADMAVQPGPESPGPGGNRRVAKLLLTQRIRLPDGDLWCRGTPGVQSGKQAATNSDATQQGG